jgi:hypothetical protein
MYYRNDRSLSQVIIVYPGECNEIIFFCINLINEIIFYTFTDFFRRSRSAFAPSPKCNFGPKGTLKKIQSQEQLMLVFFVYSEKYFSIYLFFR